MENDRERKKTNRPTNRNKNTKAYRGTKDKRERETER